MSMTVDELEGVSLVMAQHMETLSNSILNEIIDRIKEGQTISRTTDYLIWRYSQIYGFNEKVKEFIAEATGLMEEELERIFGEVLERGYARDKELYTAAGKEQIPFEENTELQQYISAVKKQTKDELTNITGTTGYMVNVNGQKVYTPTSYTLQRALDKGVNEVIEGVKDANTAVKEVIKELTDSGLRTVDYATGKHLTVESAARMCVMTGLGQVTGKIEEQNMDNLETPYVEVSWHATARPSHQVWQGRVFYWKEKDKNYIDNDKDPDIVKERIIELLLTNPSEFVASQSPEAHYQMLLIAGFEVKPLSDGNFKGVSYKDGGGFKINFRDGGMFYYHPEERSHHGGAYYKVCSGKTGARHYNLKGEEIE